MKDLFEMLERAHKLDEAIVTDHISSEELDLMISNPQFGEFDSYQQLDGMIIRTSKHETHDGIGPHGAVSTVDRYFKFVKSDDGWEAYEVTDCGEQVGEPFRLLECFNEQCQLNENIKPESIVNQIVRAIENSRFTNRSVASAGSTITMEDSDGDRTTYTVRVKYIPEFILEEELVGTLVKTTDRNRFVDESATRIIKK